ncbi:hypothetical protein SAMN05444484_10133 [Flavobacterium chilense]|uniref:Uncharacterized protein n=2 Tax=Flavobacterium chilense TaxID=946677 RepID=A0A1M6X847_9FLAO|nr:hypothetical protein SAMN05444484_10133 [Flavobacterium chilense]
MILEYLVMENHKSCFRLFKSSWGILIEFAGKINNATEDDDLKSEPNLIKINDSLFLKLNISEQNKFIHENTIYLENGLLWISDSIPDKKTKIIEIDNIEFDFLNFQIEGLFLGIASWICNYYQIPMPNYFCMYDSDHKKYLFWFDDIRSKKLLYPNVSEF